MRSPWSSVDGAVPDDLLKKVQDLPHVRQVKPLKF